MNYIEVTFDITPYEEAVADALISELGTIRFFHPELSYRNLGTGNRRPGLEQSMGRKFHSHRGRRPDLSQGRIPRSGSRHRI